MRIIRRNEKPPEPEAINLLDLKVGECAFSRYLQEVIMRIWAEPGQWRTVGLRNGQTYSGNISHSSKLQTKSMSYIRLPSAELIYTEQTS